MQVVIPFVDTCILNPSIFLPGLIVVTLSVPRLLYKYIVPSTRFSSPPHLLITELTSPDIQLRGFCVFHSDEDTV